MIERAPELRGKELIRSGAEKLFYGVALTVGNEIQYGVKAGIVGGIIGIPVGLIGGDVIKGIKECAKEGAKLGALWGWHTSHTEFNQDAAKDGMKPVRWYDWLGAVIITSNISTKERPLGTISHSESALWGQLFNPTSTSAMKDIAHGGMQVIFG